MGRFVSFDDTVVCWPLVDALCECELWVSRTRGRLKSACNSWRLGHAAAVNMSQRVFCCRSEDGQQSMCVSVRWTTRDVV